MEAKIEHLDLVASLKKAMPILYKLILKLIDSKGAEEFSSLKRLGSNAPFGRICFWLEEATFTYERATDVRHMKPSTIEELLRGNGREDEDVPDDWWHRHSIRQFFCSLLMGPTPGAKMNIDKAPMRIMTQTLSLFHFFRRKFLLASWIWCVSWVHQNYFGSSRCMSVPCHIMKCTR